MKEMTLPAYPLLTFDPMMSLWSMDKELYRSSVKMWTKHEKPINGNIVIDGKAKRFMGLFGSGTILPQKSISVGLTSTQYTFEDEKIMLRMTFTSPFRLSDPKQTSRPVSYITVAVKSLDGQNHDVKVLFDFSERIVCRNKKPIVAGVDLLADGKVAYIGRKKDTPLSRSGDRVDADWGHLFVAGNVTIDISSPYGILRYMKSGKGLKIKGATKEILVEKGIVASKEEESFFFAVGWDVLYSFEYFGHKTLPLWHEYYNTPYEFMQDALSLYDCTMKRCEETDQKIERETALFGEDYCKLLYASYRQVISAHSFATDNGKAKVISKECSSNGCAATVDVTYPTAPLFLVENPSFLRGMLDPVFDFARCAVWKYNFAPHDVGTFPYLNGQVYALNKSTHKKKNDHKKKVYCMWGDKELYRYKSQMPVEESANMILLTGAYFNETGDLEYVKKNFDLLQTWADFLFRQGISLESQLSTDDFGGQLKNNVNLAIKSVCALSVFAKLADKVSFGSGSAYQTEAKLYAEELLQKADRGDRLALVLDSTEGWSTKYNLVWDKLFDLRLFGEDIYEREIAYYEKQLKLYGLPLDSRKTYAKSDWMMWVTVLSKDEKTVQKYSQILVKMLAESTCGLPYPDLYETTATSFPVGGRRHMYARTVQGGMWLPLYALKLLKPDKINYLI